MSKTQRKRKLDVDRSLEELIDRSKKARKASKKKTTSTSKKRVPGGKRAEIKKVVRRVKSNRGGRRGTQGQGASTIRRRSNKNRRGRGTKRRGRGRGDVSRRENPGSNRVRVRGSNRRKFSGRGRNMRSRGRGRSDREVRHGIPNLLRDHKLNQTKQTERKKQVNVTVRALPPALPNGYQFSSSEKVRSNSTPMLIRLKYYNTEPIAPKHQTTVEENNLESKIGVKRFAYDALEASKHPKVDKNDLEYQITLENDEYSNTHQSPPLNERRAVPTKKLKLEKPSGLFAHIDDSASD